jgi:hypothetical protein
VTETGVTGVTETGVAETGADASVNRFITQVVNFTEGTCAGYNASSPAQVLKTVSGPPEGDPSTCCPGTDVVSLGGGGSIVVGFGGTEIVDGEGVDFVVFENPFDYGDNQRYVEPGEVSVSEDGKTWTAFPCSDTTQSEPDGGWGATHCAGMNLVFSNPADGISPFDLENAGGDPFDLAEIGVKKARYVRIRNMVVEFCPDGGAPDGDVALTKNGFDLDAIAIIHPG